ncbi:hypothetical protein [Burkholderia gladioli]|uniref:hypothetical protein n=1 Tax=Burkholderia gladioli TaxID=28095 RepID=UPI0023643A83|nr:hypothetical protein [Burkholderia gladioli]MDD1789048.1 hypothetical protein [Burkholderia gladioli]
MKIAGWEVPQALIDGVAAELSHETFDAGTVRVVAATSHLMPIGVQQNWYIREEIGTRLIDHFKRAGKIEKVPGTRRWRWIKGEKS